MPEPSEFGRAIETLIEQWLKAHPESRVHIATIADRIGDLARRTEVQPERPGETPLPEPAEAPRPPIAPSPVPAPVDIPRQSSGYVPLKLGGGRPIHIRTEGTSDEIAAARLSAMEQESASARPAQEPPSLPLIQRRCSLKAQSCRFVIERRGAPGERLAELNERVKALLTSAKATPNCFLWVLFPGPAQPGDEPLAVIASCYENLARAAALADRLGPTGEPADRRDALGLLAAAQSALRVALEQTWLTKPDRDQDDAYAYLSEATRSERIFLDRHMKRDDPADPADAASLAARIASLESHLQAAQDRRRRATTLVNAVRHHARIIADDPGGDHSHDWEKIGAKLSELDGTDSLGDSRLPDLLRPIAHCVPPHAAHVVSRVLGDDPAPADDARPREYSPGVARVREFLRGGRVVLVGGERRDEAERRIRDAFDLAGLDWISLPEHSTAAPLEAPIRRADTRLVLVMIKLAGHHHIDAAAEVCARHAKPLVRLPAGYNPEQIAAQVLEQASERLAAVV